MTESKRKTCLITGASRGIGLGVARRLDAAGYRLALTIYNGVNEDNLRRELADFRSDDHLLIPCDVVEETQVQAAFAQIDREWGGLDALVVNAGVHLRAAAMETTTDAWDHLFAVNVRGAMLCCREAACRMRNHGGAIVIIGSTAAERPYSMRAAYCATKAAAHAFAQAAALEWAPFGIRVNTIAPGPIDTDFINETVPTQDDRKALANRIPIGRIGTPRDVASAVHYLLSDEAAYVAGAVLRIDGGHSWS